MSKYTKRLSGRVKHLLTVLDAMVTEPELNEDGGPGSGNWGHKGRPGLRGGSGEGGGKQYRGGRGDIMYTSSKRDWLNGLTGEKQREAQKWVEETAKEWDNSDVQPETRPADRVIMEECPNRYKVQLLNYMSEARGWEQTAGRLTESNWDETDKKLSKALAKKYGSEVHGGAQLPDDSDWTNWAAVDKRVWLDLKSKAMGGPVSGRDVPDELQYEAGLKERPKTPINAWVSAKDITPQAKAGALVAIKNAGAKSTSLNISDLDDPAKVEAAEKEAFSAVWDDRSRMSSLREYLRIKALYCDEGWAIGSLDKTFNQAIYDRLEPMEYAYLQELAEQSKKSGSGDILSYLTFKTKNDREKMRGYALFNKALGGADVIEETDKRAREDFNKEQEELKRQAEEQKRQAEERLQRLQEAERKRKEAEAKRAPIVAAAKKALQNDGLLGKINAATTTAEVAQALSDPGMFAERDAKPDFDGMDVETARNAAVAYSTIYQEFPFLVGELDAPRAASLRSSTYAQSWYVGGRVEFNTRHFGNLDALRSSYERDVASGFHPQGLDYTSIAYHELGHSMDGWLTNKIKKTVIHGTTGSVSYDLCHSVKKALGIKGDIDTFRGMTSRYCTKGECKRGSEYREWFAETLSEAYCSRTPRPPAVELRKQLEKMIRDNGLEGAM